MCTAPSDCTPLDLSDIVHIMSPSPAPHDAPDVPTRTRTASPDSLPESDIAQMRRKVAEMRHVHTSVPPLSGREEELAEMVLKLTAVARPDQDQLLRQAEIISALTQQRDLLLHQAQEERLRWDSEKDGWARITEALFAQQAKNKSNAERDEDLDRLQNAESDNKTLRQRLNESHNRLHMLESELIKLRPLLLMQPLISRTSIPPSTPSSKTRRRRNAEDEEHAVSEEDGQPDIPDTPSQATPRAKVRKSEAPAIPHTLTSLHRQRPSQKAVSRGVSADARVEHLLLAARKIGKHRAGVISGMVHHLEEQERERKREESTITAVAPTPKTPKRNTSQAGCPSDGGYVYVNGQMRSGPGIQPVPFFIPTYHHLLQTPSSSTTAPSTTSSAQQSAQKSKQGANPPTPLDSLLSAARSMMHEDVDANEEEVVGDSPAKKAGTRRARSRDVFSSPVSKRRKVAPRSDKLIPLHEASSRAMDNASGSSNVGIGRVRSALDVLADQAAVFSSQEQTSQTQPVEEKERDDLHPQDCPNSTPKPRARIQEPEVGATTSAAPTSRSNIPQAGPATSSTATVVPLPPDLSSEALIDPGGAITLNPPPDSTPNLDGGDSPRIRSTSPDPGFDDPADTTPLQDARVQHHMGEEPQATSVTSSHLENEPPPLHPEPISSSTPPVSSLTVPLAKNKELIRVKEQEAPAPPTKRQRSPYVKWSKEEDDLLAQAVAKYGQKWDLVQKALPSRGYHQVRQRWLRKLGIFDSKPDLSSFQTAAGTFPSSTTAVTTTTMTARGEGALGNVVEPRGNPKLGLAPLSSELAFSGLAAGRRPPPF